MLCIVPRLHCIAYIYLQRKAGPGEGISRASFAECCSEALHCFLRSAMDDVRMRNACVFLPLGATGTCVAKTRRERKIFRRRRAQPETAKSRCSSTRRSSPSCNTRYSSILPAAEQVPPHTRLASPRYATSTANRTLRGRFSAPSFIVIRTPLVSSESCCRTAKRSTSACVHTYSLGYVPHPTRPLPGSRLACSARAPQTSRFSVDQIADPSAAHTQSFSEQEKELFQKYGKVPAQKNLLANKLKVRPALVTSVCEGR